MFPGQQGQINVLFTDLEWNIADKYANQEPSQAMAAKYLESHCECWYNRLYIINFSVLSGSFFSPVVFTDGNCNNIAHFELN